MTTATQPSAYVNAILPTGETLDGAAIVVRVYQILSTNIVVARLVVAIDSGLGFDRFSSVHSDADGRRWGEFTSQRLPADIDALPARSAERAAAYWKWSAKRKAWADDLIRRTVAASELVEAHRLEEHRAAASDGQIVYLRGNN